MPAWSKLWLPVRPPPAAREVLFDVPPDTIRGRCATEAIADIARAFGITAADIKGPSREAYIVRVRMLVVFLLAERGNSATAIGRWLDRDHSTVLHSIKTLPRHAKRHPAIAEALVYYRREWGLGPQEPDA